MLVTLFVFQVCFFHSMFGEGVGRIVLMACVFLSFIVWMDVFHDSESSSSVNRAIDFTSMSVCVFADFESNSLVSIVH